VCCMTASAVERLGAALGVAVGDVRADEVASAVGALTMTEVLGRLREAGVPAAPSLHHSAVPDDPQVVARGLLRQYRHPAAGRFVQVGIPLSLSVDAPAVKGPAPTPAPVRRRRTGAAATATATATSGTS
jgi:crotonobetainyl-CoA:carnitine CoA-transferase CaiB-like acyl-CoA transferase